METRRRIMVARAHELESASMAVKRPRSRRRFEGKNVVVTGASSGVGRAIARAFSEEGANVALVARGVDGLEAAAREVREAGARALVLPLDVADASAVDQAADRVVAEWGAIDGRVDDAMGSVIARATLEAVLRSRREIWIAWSTTMAILGQRIVPGLLDRYLAKHAWESQETSQLPPGHPLKHAHDNVDEPIAGDRGAHGPFDRR